MVPIGFMPEGVEATASFFFFPVQLASINLLRLNRRVTRTGGWASYSFPLMTAQVAFEFIFSSAEDDDDCILITLCTPCFITWWWEVTRSTNFPFMLLWSNEASRRLEGMGTTFKKLLSPASTLDFYRFLLFIVSDDVLQFPNGQGSSLLPFRESIVLHYSCHNYCIIRISLERIKTMCRQQQELKLMFFSCLYELYKFSPTFMSLLIMTHAEKGLVSAGSSFYSRVERSSSSPYSTRVRREWIYTPATLKLEYNYRADKQRVYRRCELYVSSMSGYNRTKPVIVMKL